MMKIVYVYMIYFVADFEFESSYENVDISQPPKIMKRVSKMV